MPRTKRTVVDGGVYHILNRGHNKDKIFYRADDYERFKEIINGYKVFARAMQITIEMHTNMSVICSRTGTKASSSKMIHTY